MKTASVSKDERSFFKADTSVGPQHYDPMKVYKNPKSTVIKNTVTPEPAMGSVKQQMETYLHRIFESADDIKVKGRA